MNDLEVYATQTAWLLEQIAINLRTMSDEALVAVPPVALETNNPLAIARHATGVARAYALGMGCGQAVMRDRSVEFTATLSERDAILAEVEALAGAVRVALPAADRARLDVPMTPVAALYGQGEPRQMTPREAIVENIRHLGIHLGELRLTRSLLEAEGPRAD